MDLVFDADMTCVMHLGGAFCIAEMIPQPARWTPEEREAAIVAAMPAVEREAIRIANGMGGATDADELISEAYVGLCVSSLRFDPSGRAKFTTFAIGYLRRRLMGRKIDAQRLDGRTYDRDPDRHVGGPTRMTGSRGKTLGTPRFPCPPRRSCPLMSRRRFGGCRGLAAKLPG